MAKQLTTDQLYAVLRAELGEVISLTKATKTTNLMKEDQIEKYCQRPVYTYSSKAGKLQREVQHESMSAYNALSFADDKKTKVQWLEYCAKNYLSQLRNMEIYPALEMILSSYEVKVTKQILGYTMLGNFGNSEDRYCTAMASAINAALAILQACAVTANLEGKVAQRNDKALGIANNSHNGNTTMLRQIAIDLTYGLTMDKAVEITRYGITLNYGIGGIVHLAWDYQHASGRIDHMSMGGQGFERKNQVTTWIVTMLRKKGFVPQTHAPKQVDELPTQEIAEELASKPVETLIEERQASRKNPQNRKGSKTATQSDQPTA